MSAQSPVTGSLFAPFFFPLGIAFMGAQSAVMMKMAGENWQYGKRRISAMSNEDFNAMTPVKLYKIETEELRAIIPDIEESLRSMTPLTATIVTEMINTFKVGAQATAAYLQDILDSPIGKILVLAIDIWMPWLKPLLGDIPDLGAPPTTETTIVEEFPKKTITEIPKKEKTLAEITKDKSDVDKEIDKGSDKLMKEYTKFINQIVELNKLIKFYLGLIAKAIKDKDLKKQNQWKMKKSATSKLKKKVLSNFATWKSNHKSWMSKHPSL